MVRPHIQDYLMSFANLAATRSTCLRRQVGAVIVKDGQVIATGYNGPARNVPHCKAPEAGIEYTEKQIIQEYICPRLLNNVPSGKVSHCWAIHAEENALLQAARHGVSVVGCKMFCTTKPCYHCIQACINAGIVCIFYGEEYNDIYSKELEKLILLAPVSEGYFGKDF